MSSNKINCPNCGTSIDVQDLVYHEAEEKFKAEYNAKMKSLEEKQDNMDAELKRKAKQKEEELEDYYRKEAREKEKRIEAKLKVELEKDSKEEFEALQKELNEKADKLKELNKAQIEIEKLKREKESLKEEAEAEAQKMINEELSKEKEKIKKLTDEQNELKFKEYEKQLEDQKKLIEEMKRKSEQGSMQMQGEVQELAIEDFLSSEFPFDQIEEIGKGKKGGDCVQTVINSLQQNCGLIYYESKRTKAWQNSWLEKFKSDMKNKNADLGVIVTETMPSDMDRLGNKDGIWICSFQEFKGLSHVLRESLITLASVKQTQENKGDKMEMLYSFLTSNEFRMQVEGIVEGFTIMKNDLSKERMAMEKIWKQREKQIEKVILNTSQMFGSIKGIAGNALEGVSSLELGE